MKRMMNRNPNWNHNSSQFYNSCLVNIKFDQDQLNEEKQSSDDLLWKNSEQYADEDQIKAFSVALHKLLLNPKFGEDPEMKNKVNKLKSIAGKMKILYI